MSLHTTVHGHGLSSPGPFQSSAADETDVTLRQTARVGRVLTFPSLT